MDGERERRVVEAGVREREIKTKISLHRGVR